jgi:beta-glucosidase
MNTQFPKDFFWGTATASFQIEGATQADGRGESIWDRFASTPGTIMTGESGEPACDSYHRYSQDIAIMRQLGVNAYRFSIAWPRVIPTGSGRVNPAGLDYYERVVDALLEARITPFVTLYHWDLPQALQERGGWANRATIEAYLSYTDAVVGRLGDRVKRWMTHNEPWCVSFLSHHLGIHAPGLRDRGMALRVAHNVLVSHGRAVPVIRGRCPAAHVGIVLNFEPSYPATDSEADKIATHTAHEKFNLWFLDPLAGRGYPRKAWHDYGEDVPEILADDLDTIATPIDFLGINYYTRRIVHDPAGGDGHRIINRRNPVNMMARGWEVWPQALCDLLKWLHGDYHFPQFYITENGATYDDEVWEGRIHDSARLDYIKQHLAVLPGLIEAEVPLKGYFCWSLMDNFEWAAGTRDRFGLAYTDFKTQERVLKDSGLWFSRVTRANALPD